MVTVKGEPKDFSDNEVANLTGICVDPPAQLREEPSSGFFACKAADACQLAAVPRPLSAVQRGRHCPTNAQVRPR